MAAVMRGVHAGATTAPMNHANGQSSTVPQPHHSNQCTCLSHCCSAPPVALVGITMAIAGVVTVATRDAGLPDYAYVPVAAQHVLPLANGPPLAA